MKKCKCCKCYKKCSQNIYQANYETLVGHHSKLNKEKNTDLELIRMGKLPPLNIKKEDC